MAFICHRSADDEHAGLSYSITRYEVGNGVLTSSCNQSKVVLVQQDRDNLQDLELQAYTMPSGVARVG
jgi:hypothetical protein